MRKAKLQDVTSPRPIAPPAKTPEARERQLTGYAVDLAERQLIDGTASSQVITHYLKASSTREQLELERLRRENILLEKKAESMEMVGRMEQLITDAVNAMRGYSGQPELGGGDDDGDDFFND